MKMMKIAKIAKIVPQKPEVDYELKINLKPTFKLPDTKVSDELVIKVIVDLFHMGKNGFCVVENTTEKMVLTDYNSNHLNTFKKAYPALNYNVTENTITITH